MLPGVCRVVTGSGTTGDIDGGAISTSCALTISWPSSTVRRTTHGSLP